MSRKNDVSSMDKILNLLATHKEFEQYKMKDATKLTYKTIIGALKKLEASGLVSYKKEVSKKGGKEKKIYALTNQGLLNVVLMDSLWTDKKEVLKLINAHRDAFLCFNKWDLFKDAGLEDFMLQSLCASSLAVRNVFAAMSQQTEFSIPVTFDLNRSVLFVPLEHNGKTPEKLMCIYKKDAELSAYIEGEFKKSLTRYQRISLLKSKWDSV